MEKMQGKFVNDLTEGSVPKQLALFSLPFLLSNFLQLLYGATDTFVVSHYGTAEDILGVSQGSQLANLVTNALIGLAMGCTVLIAQFVGAKRDKDRDETVATVFTFFLIISVALSALMLAFSSLIVRWLGVPPEAVDETLGYFRICMGGAVFVAMYNCVSAVLRGLGDSKRPLLFVAVACAVNVVLDFVLVKGFNMGANGAAIATIVSQCLSVVLAMRHLSQRGFPFDFKPSSFKIYKDKLKLIVSIGFPSALHKCTVSLSFVVLSRIINSFGLLAGSAAALVTKVNEFVILPFAAMQASVTSVVGQNVGAEKYDRATKSMVCSIAFCLVAATVMFTATRLMPEALLGIFTDRTDIMELAVPYLKMFSYEYFIMAFGFSITGLMLGSGHSLLSMASAIASSVVLRIPLAYIFAYPLGLGFPGIALGSALATIGSPLIGFIFYSTGIWKKRRLS